MYSGSSIKRNLKTKSKLSNTIERTSVSQIILQSINYGSMVLRGLAFRVLRGYNFFGSETLYDFGCETLRGRDDNFLWFIFCADSMK